MSSLPPVDASATGAPGESPARVFLSYASADGSAAEQLCRALEASGLPCWLAPRDVRAGESYAAAIVEAINACRALVLVLSANAIDSPHVLREVERASSKRRPVLAVRLDDSALPPALEYFLSANQWLDARMGGIEPVVPALVASIRGAVGAPGGAGAAAPRAALLATVATGAAKTGRRAGTLALGGIVLVLVAVVGYLLIERSRPPTPPAAAAANTPAAGAGPSIAVLPFVDMSEKRDQEYFSDGLSEELLDLLAKTPGLAVIARTSSFYFKGKQVTIGEVARTLKVTDVLEGSVRKAGNTIRVTAQLVRGSDGVHVWSETYDRDFKDVFRVQDDIAAAVVAALKLHLLPGSADATASRTLNTEAYTEYLIGRQATARENVDGFRAAVAAYRKAIALDPGYALAYAGLSRAELYVAEFTDFGDGFQRAAVAADKAIALAPELAAGYVARGYLRNSYLLDFVGAQADLEKAVALSPGDSDAQTFHGIALVTVGRLTEAKAALERAAALDPLAPTPWAYLAQLDIAQRDFGAARGALDRVLSVAPDSFFGEYIVAILELAQGHYAEALAAAQKVTVRGNRSAMIAAAEFSLGHLRESDAALAELIAHDRVESAYQIAQVYAWRGEKQKAYEWLDTAYRQHDGGLEILMVDATMASLRRDPAFQGLLRKLKLAP